MKELDLLNGPVRKTLLRFSVPTILGMAATQFYTVADTMVIGKFMDKYALGATSNAASAMMFFLFISGGLELGAGLLTAAKKPKLERDELSRLIYNMLILDIAVGLLMLLIGIGELRHFLLLINTPEEILDAAVLYGRIYLLGLPFQMLYDLSRQVVISCGESRIPLFVISATSGLNIVLDLLLVCPFGVAGAAAASVAVQVLGCLFMLVYLRRTMLVDGFRFHHIKSSYFLEIIHLAVPNTVQQAAPTVAALVKQGLLGTLGVAEIDGFSCATKLSTLFMMPIYGFTQSLVVYIAQNRTAEQTQRIREGVREMRKLMLGYMTAVLLICLLLNRQLLSLFTDDGLVIQYGATLLTLESWSYAVTAMKHLREAQLRGEMKMSLYLLSSLLPIGINILCCLLLVPKFGYAGFYLTTFICAPFSLILASGLVKYANIEQNT